MTSFIFCLIFIQVSIFFIVGIILMALFYNEFRQNTLVPAKAASRNRVRQRRARFTPALVDRG